MLGKRAICLTRCERGGWKNLPSLSSALPCAHLAHFHISSSSARVRKRASDVVFYNAASVIGTYLVSWILICTSPAPLLKMWRNYLKMWREHVKMWRKYVQRGRNT